MREILFRGKQKSNGAWLFGDLRQWSATRKGICDYDLKSTNEVDPATVGQFTGLTDKNGASIFEGDIVSVGGHIATVNGLYRVIYDTVNHCWALARSTENHFSYFTFSDLNGFAGTSEVVGNIHDNPELLEVKE